MALTLINCCFHGSHLGRYKAEVLLTRWYHGHPRGELKYTYYKYIFNDSLLYDEIRSDEITKKRLREIIRHIRDNAQYILRHNDYDYKRRDDR